jgi:hypothetical protein
MVQTLQSCLTHGVRAHSKCSLHVFWTSSIRHVVRYAIERHNRQFQSSLRSSRPATQQVLVEIIARVLAPHPSRSIHHGKNRTVKG